MTTIYYNHNEATSSCSSRDINPRVYFGHSGPSEIRGRDCVPIYAQLARSNIESVFVRNLANYENQRLSVNARKRLTIRTDQMPLVHTGKKLKISTKRNVMPISIPVIRGYIKKTRAKLNTKAYNIDTTYDPNPERLKAYLPSGNYSYPKRT